MYLEVDPCFYLGTVLITSTYVGQAVKVERQPFRHGEHLNGKSAALCQAVNREPVERVVNRAAGDNIIITQGQFKYLKCITHCKAT